MRVVKIMRGSNSAFRLVIMTLVVWSLLVSCVGVQVEPEEEIQFSLPVVEQVPTKVVKATATVTPLPTIAAKPTMSASGTLSEDDLSVAVAPEIIEPSAIEQAGEGDVAIEEPDVLPEEYYIRNIIGHKQFYPLGCEASVAIDLANYFGVSIIESEFQNRLPLSDNPDYGFVGSVEGPWGQVPPYAYGVHAGPVG